MNGDADHVGRLLHRLDSYERAALRAARAADAGRAAALREAAGRAQRAADAGRAELSATARRLRGVVDTLTWDFGSGVPGQPGMEVL